MIEKQNQSAKEIVEALGKSLNYLYNACLVITGNHQTAQDVLTELFMQLGKSFSHKHIENKAIRFALRYANKQAACEVDFLTDCDSLDFESSELRRATILRFGCGLTVSETARVMGLKTGEISAFESRAIFVLKHGNTHARKKALCGICLAALKAGTNVPTKQTLLQSVDLNFELQKDDLTYKAARSPIFSIILAVVMLSLVGILAWLLALILNYLRLIRA